MAEIPTEALEAAERAGEGHPITIGGGGFRWNGAYCRCGWESGVGEMTQQQAASEGWRHVLTEALTAAAPFLIAEGRRQALDELHYADSSFDAAAEYLREWTGRADDPTEQAGRHLRRGRERQAGLDYERIERARTRLAEGSDGD